MILLVKSKKHFYESIRLDTLCVCFMFTNSIFNQQRKVNMLIPFHFFFVIHCWFDWLDDDDAMYLFFYSIDMCIHFLRVFSCVKKKNCVGYRKMVHWTPVVFSYKLSIIIVVIVLHSPVLKHICVFFYCSLFGWLFINVQLSNAYRCHWNHRNVCIFHCHWTNNRRQFNQNIFDDLKPMPLTNTTA